MIKVFDCVKVKQKAGKILSKKLNKMSVQEQLKFWQKKHDDLSLLKKNSLKRRGAIKPNQRLK